MQSVNTVKSVLFIYDNATFDGKELSQNFEGSNLVFCANKFSVHRTYIPFRVDTNLLYMLFSVSQTQGYRYDMC